MNVRSLVAIAVALVGVPMMPVIGGADLAGVVLAAPEAQQTEVRVIKRYGAAIRDDATADAEVLINAKCNETFMLLAANGSWRQIFQVVGQKDELTEDEDDDIFGWIQSDHVVVGTVTAPVDCAAAPSHKTGAKVQSSSDPGCMALRAEPVVTAAQSECRPDGVVYEVVSGPTPDPSDEWFEVRPTNGGSSGWARAAELFPVP